MKSLRQDDGTGGRGEARSVGWLRLFVLDKVRRCWALAMILISSLGSWDGGRGGGGQDLGGGYR